MPEQEIASLDFLAAAERVRDKYEQLWLKEVMKHQVPHVGEPALPNNYWQAEHIAHKKYQMAASVVEAIKDAWEVVPEKD